MSAVPAHGPIQYYFPKLGTTDGIIHSRATTIDFEDVRTHPQCEWTMSREREAEGRRSSVTEGLLYRNSNEFSGMMVDRSTSVTDRASLTDGMSVTDESSGTTGHKKTQYKKTKLCPWHREKKCFMGAACNYAHTREELRPKPDLSKTKLCPEIVKGKKCDRPGCRFAHDFVELRATSAFYKTRICKFWQRGHCPAGTECRHAHGTQDLRAEEPNELDPQSLVQPPLLSRQLQPLDRDNRMRDTGALREIGSRESVSDCYAGRSSVSSFKQTDSSDEETRLGMEEIGYDEGEKRSMMKLGENGLAGDLPSPLREALLKGDSPSFFSTKPSTPCRETSPSLPGNLYKNVPNFWDMQILKTPDALQRGGDTDQSTNFASDSTENSKEEETARAQDQLTRRALPLYHSQNNMLDESRLTSLTQDFNLDSPKFSEDALELVRATTAETEGVCLEALRQWISQEVERQCHARLSTPVTPSSLLPDSVMRSLASPSPTWKFDPSKIESPSPRNLISPNWPSQDDATPLKSKNFQESFKFLVGQQTDPYIANPALWKA